LTVGYSLPVEKLIKMKISKLRFYFTANNLAVFTKYTGFDPEIAGGILDTGIDRGAYPQARTFAFGFDIKL
jgi:hypothetical protein